MLARRDSDKKVAHSTFIWLRFDWMKCSICIHGDFPSSNCSNPGSYHKRGWFSSKDMQLTLERSICIALQWQREICFASLAATRRGILPLQPHRVCDLNILQVRDIGMCVVFCMLHVFLRVHWHDWCVIWQCISQLVRDTSTVVPSSWRTCLAGSHKCIQKNAYVHPSRLLFLAITRFIRGTPFNGA